MSGNCVICTKNITKGRFPGVKCAKCDQIYHLKCAEISDELLNGLRIGSATWICIKCRSSTNISILEDGGEDCNLQSNMDTSIKSDNIVCILKSLQNQLDDFKTTFNFLCKTLDDIKETITNLSKENESLRNKVITTELKYNILENKINLLEAAFDRSNQNECKRNIVVVGLPANCQEVNKTIYNIIGKIGVSLTENDITAIQQMFHSNKTQSFLKYSYIVTLKTTEIKNNILVAFRKIKSFQFKIDESSSIHKIFILHHLTKLQSKLYNEAKKIKNKHKFQFLWCNDGKIFLRKSPESNVYNISSFNDICRINKSCLDDPLPQDTNITITGNSASTGSSSQCTNHQADVSGK